MSHAALPLLGGLLIGLATTIMLGGIGRITGISGIIFSAIFNHADKNIWRYAFLLGLLSGGLILLIINPNLFNYSLEYSNLRVVIAGLLVGFGTKLGSGCTSGHGVCGLARLSSRSLLATLIFMSCGILTVWIEGLLK